MKNDYLRIIFYKKLSQYSQDTSLINGTFDKLLKLYNTDKRYYHDLTHIISLLKIWEDHKHLLKDDEVVYLAIWFHDAIYDSWKSNNEEKSAEMAKDFLQKINFSSNRIEKVVQYILATKTHHHNESDSDLDFFLDFDMAILGAEDAIYDVYMQQIRDEYSLFPTFMFNRGRKKLLKSFMAQTSIFKTEEFRKKLESQAYDNIKKELAML